MSDAGAVKEVKKMLSAAAVQALEERKIDQTSFAAIVATDEATLDRINSIAIRLLRNLNATEMAYALAGSLAPLSDAEVDTLLAETRALRQAIVERASR